MVVELMAAAASECAAAAAADDVEGAAAATCGAGTAAALGGRNVSCESRGNYCLSVIQGERERKEGHRRFV